MKYQHVINGLAFLALSSMSLICYAGEGFFVANDTTYQSSFKINKSDCSTAVLGVKGLINKNVLGGINETVTASICGESKTNCTFDIYMSKDCSGPMVASVTFDINKGVVAVDSKKVNGFFVTKKSDTTIYVTGGPLLPQEKSK